MPSPLPFSRVRSVLGVLVAALLALATLSACSSSGAPEYAAAATVADNGQRYAFAAGSVPQSEWPKVCSLLPESSAAAALGDGVTASSFHQRCFYVPGNDAFPTLTVTTLGIGSDLGDQYDQVRDMNSRYRPRNVDGVGMNAATFTLSISPTVVLVMLTDQGLFEIALRSPAGNQAGPAEALGILKNVGRALAREFAG